MTNVPDIVAVLRDVRCEIAIAKLAELDFQSHRLGELVREGLIARGTAAEVLYDAALSNGLVEIHGPRIIENILVDRLGVSA
jgi:hypothetical protein